jgi:uncharacterized GH25 family protein
LKKSMIFGIVLGLSAALCGVVYMMSADTQSGSNSLVGKSKSLISSMIPEKPSPYSIKWGAGLARIVDQQGNGVAGASITITAYLTRNCNGNATGQAPSWQGTVLKANEKGEFTFPPEIWVAEEGKKKPRVRIKIEAAGFLPRSTQVGLNYSQSRGEIDIFRPCRIDGQLIDPNGLPIANAPIRVDSYTKYKNPNISSSVSASASPKTDEKGCFVVENVAPGNHTIRYPGYAGGCGQSEPIEIPYKDYPTHKNIVIKDGEKMGVFLDLGRPGADITGRVVDRDNRPMAGVNAVTQKVYRFYSGGGITSMTTALSSVLTDENGRYVLTNMPMGEYQIVGQYPYVEGKNYRPGKPLNIYVAGTQAVSFDLVLERQDDSMAKSLRDGWEFEVPLPDELTEREMMIVDPRGNGIAAAKIVFAGSLTVTDKKTKKKTQKNWPGAALTTDHRGVFMLPLEVAASDSENVQCTAVIDAAGFQKRHCTLYPYSLKKRRIDILPYSTISGKLIGDDGKPVKGLVEMAHRATSYINPGSSSSGGGYGSSPTGDDGSFRFEKITEGVHVIRYSVPDPDKKSPSVGGVVVHAKGGKAVEGLLIDLRENNCSVTGRVLDNSGEPVKKAYVRLLKTIRIGRRGTSTFSPDFYRSQPSKRKGDFAIEGIRTGVYEIQAILEGKRQQTSKKMTIAVSDGQTIKLDIRLKP